jgi:hypothetical protein
MTRLECISITKTAWKIDLVKDLHTVNPHYSPEHVKIFYLSDNLINKYLTIVRVQFFGGLLHFEYASTSLPNS